MEEILHHLKCIKPCQGDEIAIILHGGKIKLPAWLYVVIWVYTVPRMIFLDYPFFWETPQKTALLKKESIFTNDYLLSTLNDLRSDYPTSPEEFQAKLTAAGVTLPAKEAAIITHCGHLMATSR